MDTPHSRGGVLQLASMSAVDMQDAIDMQDAVDMQDPVDLLGDGRL